MAASLFAREGDVTMHDGRWERGNSGVEVFDVETPRAARPRTARADRTPGARRRRGFNWRPLSLLAMATLTAVAVVALADKSPIALPAPSAALATATPTATTAPPEPTGETPSAVATLGPYWPAQIDLPLITVPADATHIANFQLDSPPSPSGPPIGPFTYGVRGDTPDEISVIDLGRGGSSTLAPLPLKTGEQLFGVSSDGSWAAILVAETGGTKCGRTMPWRLLAARVGPDGLPVGGTRGFAQLASGTRIAYRLPSQSDCVAAPTPFGLDGGRLAWSEPAAKGRGSVVKVRALDGGGTAIYASDQYVIDLEVSADAVAWVQSPDPLARST
jgi:hypothetical protein